MLARLYILIFIAVSVLTGLLLASGNADDLLLAGLGFLLSTLFFIGLVGLLPWWVDRKFSWP